MTKPLHVFVARALRVHASVASRAFPLLALFVGVLFAGCVRHSSPRETSESRSSLVKVAPVRLVQAPVVIETNGLVRPVQHAVLAARVMGAIEEFDVALGQNVRAGDILVKIAGREISARLEQVHAQLNLARRDLVRERELLAKGASTSETVNALQDHVAETEAMIREAEAMLAYTIVRAPFDGVIARKLAYAGDLASPGSPLIELEGAREFEIEAALPDSLVSQLQPGTQLPISIPVARVSFTGSITELSSAADPTAHGVTAKISIPAGTPVRSGQYARIQIPGSPVPTLLVPASAVSRFGQIERVFVVSNRAPSGSRAEAVLRIVKTGVAHGNETEILTGLNEGEFVVIEPTASLREGQALEIQP